jgi:hypothetical protein
MNSDGTLASILIPVGFPLDWIFKRAKVGQKLGGRTPFPTPGADVYTVGMERAPSYTRLPGESTVAHAAFTVYRDLGPGRSLRKVARMLGKSRQLLDRWSVQWDWVQRASAWDEQRDEVNRRANLLACEQMSQRHAALALLCQEKVVERLASMTQDDIAAMSIRDVCALLHLAEEIERRARGVGNLGSTMTVHSRSRRQDGYSEGDTEANLPTIAVLREDGQAAAASMR